MSNRIITDSRDLVAKPKDAYWDAPITRREVQEAVNAICLDMNLLQNMQDTSNIVMNLLCTKLNVTRGEIDVYVSQLKASLKPAAPEGTDERPNS